MIDKISIKGEIAQRLHFRKASFKKMTILFGGNGAGKTTLLDFIEKNMEKTADTTLDEAIEGFTSGKGVKKESYVRGNITTTNDRVHVVKRYSNSKHNERHNNPNPFGESQTYATKLARRLHANYMSEGQSIVYSLSQWVSKLMDSITEDLEYVVLLDEVDSGLSVDHVNVVLHLLNDTLFTLPNVQVFISSNMYHWVFAAKRVFSMYTGKFIEIGSYEEYFQIQRDNQQMVGAKSDFNFL